MGFSKHTKLLLKEIYQPRLQAQGEQVPHAEGGAQPGPTWEGHVHVCVQHLDQLGSLGARSRTHVQDLVRTNRKGSCSQSPQAGGSLDPAPGSCSDSGLNPFSSFLLCSCPLFLHGIHRGPA